ncbi:DUF6766 family protein [Agrococcus beijingensis]|uniref:DUF6766 family protein n=1 Tax=Agrococcus beijingensis TaxID=3068634 RepID=UPI00274093E7|nr:DUF6766 family protein [Agrococcus sp. REN33]
MRNHGLSIAFGAAFLVALVGQSIAGFFVFNAEQQSHGADPVAFGDFVTSSQFLVDVAENWQSEYLQFFLFIFATIWLVQRGSPESKKRGEEGLGTDEEQLVHEHARADSPKWAKVRGWRHALLSNSLLLTMGTIFVLSWLAQSLAGVTVFNEEQAQHGEAAIGWLDYIVSADFWNRTLQNWQSEFLAVGSMIALSIYLRQRGSPESKQVGAPHGETDVSP